MTTPDQGGGQAGQAGTSKEERLRAAALTTPAGIHAFLRRPSGRPLSLFAEDEDDAGERHRSRQGGGDCGG
jgi:hypothetical protein